MRRTLFVLWGLSLVLVILGGQPRFQALFSKTGLKVLVTLVILTFSVTSLFLPPLDDSSPSTKPRVIALLTSLFRFPHGFVLIESFLGAVMAWLLIVAVPTLAFVFFLFQIYPRVPQEFGGTRPRCAYLDITKAQISNETLNDIIPADGLKSSDPVLRSSRVDILFSGGDVLMIRAQGKIYQISKSAIQLETNCE